MIKKLSKFTKGYNFYTVITPILIVFEVAIEVTLPFIISKIIDVGIEGSGGTLYVIKLGALMLTLAFISLMLGGFAGRTCAVASMGFAKNLRYGLFSKIQDFSFANIDKFSTPSLITRATTDITNIQNAYMMLLRLLVRSPLMLLCATGFAMNINLKLALIFLIAIPVVFIGVLIIGGLAYPRFIRLLKKYDLMNANVQEDLAAIRVVKTFVREDHESEKFRTASAELKKWHVKAEKIVVVAMPIMTMIIYTSMLMMFWFGGNFIIKGSMSKGQLASFLAYIVQIFMSLMMLAFIFIMVIMSRASASRVIEVLEEDIDIKDNENGLERVANGDIVFENVSFSYSADAQKHVLRNISFAIKSGETVGIIGGTGSSKTSLVQLIPRLYDATEGRVTVGGEDVKNYKLDTLRGSVAMVLQKNVLFSGTIRENLLWGDANATDEQILNACKIADAYDFIMSFPEGLDTDLGQGGVNVSGGQKQRLCIARALLKSPQIMILDDSTSAVDTSTDKKIRTKLKQNLQNMTTLIIAQRVASVMDADKIILLDDGAINAIGTHQQLMKDCEIYREVYFSQTNKGVE